MSIEQILEKAWEDCRKKGVELSSVTFDTTTCSPFKSRVKEVNFYGLAVGFNEKPQNQPDE